MPFLLFCLRRLHNFVLFISLDDFLCTGGPNVQPQHVSVLTAEIQGLVNMSIPRVVRAFPQR